MHKVVTNIEDLKGVLFKTNTRVKSETEGRVFYWINGERSPDNYLVGSVSMTRGRRSFRTVSSDGGFQ